MRRLALITAVLLAALSAPAGATTYTVGTTTDPSATACSSGACSLRGLILQAEAHPFPPDVIVVPPGTYTLDQGLGALTISGSVAIQGSGANVTTVAMTPPASRGTSSLSDPRVFDIQPMSGGQTPVVSITGLTITGGTANANSSSFGGDIRSTGDVTLADDAITNGFACSGAGVANVSGTMTVERTLIAGNSSECGGGDSGGIENFGAPGTPDLSGHLTLDDSTITGNDARLGAGIFSFNDANNTVLVMNSTIAGNTNKDEPSGVARSGGAGLGLGEGLAEVGNTILAGNAEVTGGMTTPTNCAPGPGILSLGHNIDSGNDCGLSASLVNTDPLLGPLQGNGGPTATMALEAGSPALDAVPAAGAGCPATDQRGVPRPQGAACDIGAYEAVVIPAPTPLPTSPPALMQQPLTIAPPPKIGASVSGSYHYYKPSLTRIATLTIGPLHSPSTVVLSCTSARHAPSGHECPFLKKAFSVTKYTSKVDLAKYFDSRKLALGTGIEITATKSGTVGLDLRLVTRKLESPSRTTLCLPPGAKSAHSC